MSPKIACSAAAQDAHQNSAKRRAMKTLALPDDFLAGIFQSRPMEPVVAIEHALIAKIDEGVVVGTERADLDHYAELGCCQSAVQQHPRPIRVKYWAAKMQMPCLTATSSS